MNCPGTTTWITPAHMHINLELLDKAGMLPSSTVGAPGTHGAGVAGMHGIEIAMRVPVEPDACTFDIGVLRQRP